MNRSWLPFQASPEPETQQRARSPDTDRLRSKPDVTSSGSRTQSSKIGSYAEVRSDALSFRNMHEYGALLTKYLEARKNIFLNDLGWHLAEADGMEFDQYDNPQAQWIILHRFGEVLGGVRMLPTTARCGIYSYMLRDAQNGLLGGMPTDVLFFEAPVEHNVWEATRFFIVNTVPAAQRLDVQKLLFNSMALAASKNGAVHVLGIVPAVWARWSRRLGVKATPIGAKFTVDNFASQSVLFKVGDFQDQFPETLQNR